MLGDWATAWCSTIIDNHYSSALIKNNVYTQTICWTEHLSPVNQQSVFSHKIIKLFIVSMACKHKNKCVIPSQMLHNQLMQIINQHCRKPLWELAFPATTFNNNPAVLQSIFVSLPQRLCFGCTGDLKSSHILYDVLCILICNDCAWTPVGVTKKNSKAPEDLKVIFATMTSLSL